MYGNCAVKKGVRLKNHTTFHIGGKAELFAVARETDDVVRLSREYSPLCDVTYLGRGSNVLISDKGVSGLVVLMRTEKSEFSGSGCIAEAGVPLSLLSGAYLSRSLSGLEFACCIPGSLGGALKMNAGAHGKCMADIVEWVEVLRGGEVVRLKNRECGFAYRASGFAAGDVILRASLNASEADKCDLQITTDKYKAFRREHQPTGFSAGSVFKAADKPAGYYIDAAGLKGLECGGAFVSEKHANFIVNSGFATAENVTALIDEIKARVVAVFGVELKEEIIYLGDFN